MKSFPIALRSFRGKQFQHTRSVRISIMPSMRCIVWGSSSMSRLIRCPSPSLNIVICLSGFVTKYGASVAPQWAQVLVGGSK
jgi:hypothetical protein